MTLTIDSNLQTAQDGISHRPEISLDSKPLVPDIPFDGQFLNVETLSQSQPTTITHSSGRILSAYWQENLTFLANEVIKYVYTDVPRQIFTTVTFDVGDITDSGAKDGIIDLSLEELPNGDVAMVYSFDDDTNNKIRIKTMTVTGSQLTDVQLDSFSNNIFFSGAFVKRLNDLSYMMVYVKKPITSADEYVIYKRTSTDFITWAAEVDITPSGIPDLSMRIDHPSINQLDDNEIWLWFDYLDATGASGGDITNIYFSTSTDNGVSWTAVTKHTNYTTVALRAEHPIAIQKTTNEFHLTYDHVQASLNMDDTAIGWVGSSSDVRDMHFDSVNRKLYVISVDAADLNSVNRIDIDTWTVDKGWTCGTTPAFNSTFCSQAIGWRNNHGDENLIPIIKTGTDSLGDIQATLLDADSDTITLYAFFSNAGAGITKNVTWDDHGGTFYSGRTIWMDKANNRLYTFFTNDQPFGGKALLIMYIDVTEAGPGFTAIEVVRDLTWTSGNEGSDITKGGILVDPDNDFIFVASTREVVNTNNGRLSIYNISSGGTFKQYFQATHTSFPKHGLRFVTFDGTFVYGSFNYEPGFGEEDKRGLCIINIFTDEITYSRPTWASMDEYSLWDGDLISGNRILITSVGNGMTIYHTDTGVWDFFSNAEIPGLTPSGGNTFLTQAYDETNETICAGHNSSEGVVCFSINGNLKRTFFQIATFTASWAYIAEAPMVQGLDDFNMALTLDPDNNSLFVFWVNDKLNELSIKWDKEDTTINLVEFVVRNVDIIYERSINGDTNKLSFSLSRGDLFDPRNNASLLAIALRKGREITFKMGEDVIGVGIVLQDMGKFVVVATSISYERNQHPVIEVVCEDLRNLWDVMRVNVSENYETDPITILTDILTDEAGVAVGDVNLPGSFQNQIDIFIQFVDTTIKDMLDQVANRFGYYITVEVDNKIGARLISDGNSVDHTYTDNTVLLNFSPDDTFSDFTNRIEVHGEERTFIEVLFAEEQLATLTGTIGFWGNDEDYRVFYSPDGSRRARFPRLEVVQSVTSIGFRLAGGVDEKIGFVDPNEKFVDIEVDVPNLKPIMVVLLLALLGTSKIPGGGWVKDAIVFAIIEAILQILGSIASFKYEIHAQPVGKVRRSVQAISDDSEFQNEIGQVVKAVFDDPLCYSVPDCKVVADFELMLAKLQRKRIRFSKIAHLQDQEGDTIQVVHPVSLENLKIFITDLKRRIRKPFTENGVGYVIDDIEGWVVS